MPTWEEIFTSNNPAGGRMINVISGVAGSEASPYTANNPAGGRAINVNIVGGGAGAGVLQLQNNVPLDTTLRSVTDQAGTLSPLQLSTTQVAVVGALGGGLIFKDYDATQGGIWSKNVTPSSRNYALISNGDTTYINGTSLLRSSINDAVQTQLTTTGLYIGGAVSASARLHVNGDGTNPIAMFEGSGTVGNLVVFGTAATNAFPAIKRNGAAIDFKLADDTTYCVVNMGQATFGGSNGYIGINNSASIDSALRNIRTNSGSSPLSISTGEIGVGDTTTYASAIFAIGSTTRGFLPPRMTTAQKTAISAPAAGLVVYDTTLNKLCVYTTAWEVITSV